MYNKYYRLMGIHRQQSHEKMCTKRREARNFEKVQLSGVWLSWNIKPIGR
jgi:hypothetical protein